MKNAIQHFLFTALLTCLVSSVTGAPAPAMAGKSTILGVTEPVGGAYLIFAGKTGGKIGKKDMEGQTRLAMNGCPGAKESTILRFTLEITKGGKTSTLQASSNKLTSEMVAKLKSLATGDTFEFKKVMAHLPGSKDEFEVHTQKFIVA